MFAVVWAWINFTWFASAYDTDDWIYRLTTMVQMAGVVILALGLPAMFDSFDAGERLDNRAMVVGYVVMRVPMVSQWLRAARQDPVTAPDLQDLRAHDHGLPRSAGCCCCWSTCQATTMLLLGVPLVLVELAGPLVCRAHGRRHAVASASHRRALRPAGDHRPRRGAARHRRLARRRHRPRGVDGRRRADRARWRRADVRHVVDLLPAAGRRGAPAPAATGRSCGATGTIFVFAAIAAVGAGLHVAALYHRSTRRTSSNTAVMLVDRDPGRGLLRRRSASCSATCRAGASHTTWLTLAKLGIVVLSVVLAAAGVDLAICILVIAARAGDQRGRRGDRVGRHARPSWQRGDPVIAGYRCAVCGASVDVATALPWKCPNATPARPVSRAAPRRRRASATDDARRPQPVRALRPAIRVVGVRPCQRHVRRTTARHLTRPFADGFAVTPFGRSDRTLRRARRRTLGQGRDRQRGRVAQGAPPRRDPAPSAQPPSSSGCSTRRAAAGDRLVRQRRRSPPPRWRAARRLAARRVRARPG